MPDRQQHAADIDPMKVALEQFYNRLTPTQVLCLRERVAMLSRMTGGTLSLGTACSGSDLVKPVLDLLSELLEEQFGVTLGFKHLYLRELDEKKQEWIRSHFPALPTIYPDICQMTGDVATDIDGPRG